MAGPGCGECNGSGLMECMYHNNTKMECDGCDGQGGIVCTTCNGYGYQRTGSDERCLDCDLGAVSAHGVQSGTSCDKCGGDGQVCYYCDDSGLVDCIECSG